MKKFCLLFTCCIAVLLSCKSKKDNRVPDGVMDMPSFNVLLTDSTTIFNTGSIKAGTPTIFVYFDPDCENCQGEINMLLRHSMELNGARIYFLGNNEIARLRKFAFDNSLQAYPTVTIAKDHTYSMLNVYRAKSVPFTVVYNDKNSLVKMIEGKANLEEIKQALNL